MNPRRYVLRGRHVIVEPDLMKWAKAFELSSRVIGRDIISPEVEVSTVFLGLDYQFGDGPPLLFETVVFGGELDEERWRYSTYDEAETGHKNVVEMAKRVTT